MKNETEATAGEALKPYAKITLDWTFKRVFASDTSTRLLVGLINTVLKKQLVAPVVEVELTQTVELGLTEENRGAVFDLQCKDNEGRYFLVEMQMDSHDDFINRAYFGLNLRYTALAEKSQRQGKAFKIPALYHISFMNFDVDFGEGCDEAVQYLSLRNDRHPWVRYHMVHMAFVRLTRFVKEEKDCKTRLDKLIFAIKNAQDLSEQPKSFKGEMFDEIFDLAKIAKFTEEERMTYEQRLKYKSVYEGNIDFARKDGRREGQKEGIAIGEARGSFRQAQKMARWMLSKGMSIADIEEATGLDEPEILALE